MKQMKKIAWAALLAAVAVAGLWGWDDEKLFTTTTGGGGKANLILVQDTSGSMCSVIYHPDFNLNVSLSSYSNVDLPRSTNNYEGIGQTSWYLRWVNGTTIRGGTGRVQITSWDEGTGVLRVNNRTTYIKEGDWILQCRDYDTNLNDDDIEFNINYQMVAQVTDVHSNSYYNYTDLTLDPTTIKGTPTVGRYIDICSYNSSSYSTRVVKLYGSTFQQGDYRVAYGMDQLGGENTYLQWIFGVANDAQRQQVTDFSTLAYDTEYNNYLRSTPVAPDAAFALNPDNSNSSRTLLEEYNDVMRAITPSKIAKLDSDLTTTTTVVPFRNGEASIQTFPAGGGFNIKIDAETLRVTGVTYDEQEQTGSFTVQRAYNNTGAAVHYAGQFILVYDDDVLGINEYTPVKSLFSSLQHVDEPTGEPNTAWTETLDGKTCWRYKRIFTRIQTAREVLGDMFTSKESQKRAANLMADATSDATVIYYQNAIEGFGDWAPPFYIRVFDPATAGSSEIMQVTGHDAGASELTVVRAQQGSEAKPHALGSTINVFSGNRDAVRIGMFSFSSNPSLMSPLNDYGKKNADHTYAASAYVNNELDQIAGLTASGSTALARALAMVWDYLKPNPNTGAAGANYITSNYSAVDINTWGGSTDDDDKYETLSGATHVSPKGSPIQYWCQNNFAVMITDGVATNDGSLDDSGMEVFASSSDSYINKVAPASGVLNDYYKFNFNLSQSSRTPWGDAVDQNERDNANFLADVAYFVRYQDMFPTVRGTDWSSASKLYLGTPVTDARLFDESNVDPYKQWPDDQNIRTHTIGMCIANDALRRAAVNGGGINFTASSYGELSKSFQEIVSSISLLQEPMTYTTYAAPKQSITGGRYGYVAHFVPRERSVWEGHLRRFRLSDTGDFPLNLDVPGATVSVDGANIVSLQWNAAQILAARTTDRTVYTAKPGASGWELKDFMSTGIDAADLDVSTSAQVATVKNFIRNMEDSSGNDVTGYEGSDTNWPKLGETFHFNPQLVGYPLIWRAAQDPSYASFYEKYSDQDNPATPLVPTPRKEVVYVGANDGKLHCFQASNGAELWSYVPYAQLKKLKEPALNPSVADKHTYFNDGKSLVRDIRVSTAFNDYRDWRTGLFWGMGIGGRSYSALDITDPDNPVVLWEFDDSYSASNTEGRMGYTEAKPLVVEMNAGAGNFPAAILAGGYNSLEIPLDSSMPYYEWQKREGKALYILDARDGSLVKKFLPGAGTSTASIGYFGSSPELKCAVTAAPIAFDSNNDGIADYLYFAESGDPNGQGGRIWKVNCFGNPLNWTAQVLYQAEAGQTIYISPTISYDRDYRVWVMLGTGRRPQAAYGSESTGFTNLNGQFIAFMDYNIPTGTYLTNADLMDVTDEDMSGDDNEYELVDSDGNQVSRGFYFDFSEASGGHEIMFEPSPLVVSFHIYFMTFAPEAGTASSGSSDDPCDTGAALTEGQHYVYEFDFDSRGGTFTINNFIAETGKILGYGPMGSQWKIYKGNGAIGNFDPDKPKDPIDLPNMFGPIMWKEIRQ